MRSLGDEGNPLDAQAAGTGHQADDSQPEELVLGFFPPIPNERLEPSDIPVHGAPWPDLIDFALSLDGYAELGDRCGDIANDATHVFASTGRLPANLDLTLLRCCLFFEQRRYHHFGSSPSEDDMRYVWALLDAIRDALVQS